jgi:hypothetical protein
LPVTVDEGIPRAIEALNPDANATEQEGMVGAYRVQVHGLDGRQRGDATGGQRERGPSDEQCTTGAS